jgi:type II secretory pathway pseudopilin PulG
MRTAATGEAARPGEEGYMLLAVICLLALLIIALSVALPQISKEIQRDREIETMHRGKQYIRAIKMYYKKFSAYPPNMDALTKPSGPGNLRFLRKKYIDPTTGKDEWKPIHMGQNKCPTAMGFFGQPLAGGALSGVGAAGGNTVAGAQTLGTSLAPSTDSGAGAPTGGTDSGTGGTGSTIGAGSSLGGSSLTGQTFGGLGIIGVSPSSPKQSILVYKKKSHYNEWEFVYDPLSDMTAVGGNNGAVGQPIGTGGAPGTGIGGSGLTGTGGIGNTGGTPITTPTAPTTPTN